MTVPFRITLLVYELCARCGRRLLHPHYIGGTAYGVVCFRKVSAVQGDQV